MARSQSPDTAVINELMRCYFYPDAVITTSTNGPSEGFSAQISTEETPSGASVTTAFIEITSQPCKELRFRYVREDSRAVIHGRESGFVKAKIRNYSGPYSVRASLVTDEAIRRPHPHKLKGSNCNDGVWEKSCNDYFNEEPEFELNDVGLVGMKINADGKEVRRSLEERKARGIDPFNSGDFTGHNLKPFIHQVRICFEATILLDGQFVTLPAVVSDPIRNTRHRLRRKPDRASPSKLPQHLPHCASGHQHDLRD